MDKIIEVYAIARVVQTIGNHSGIDVLAAIPTIALPQILSGKLGFSAEIKYSKLICSKCGKDMFSKDCSHINNFPDENGVIIYGKPEGIQPKAVAIVENPDDENCIITHLLFKINNDKNKVFSLVEMIPQFEAAREEKINLIKTHFGIADIDFTPYSKLINSFFNQFLQNIEINYASKGTILKTQFKEYDQYGHKQNELY